MCSLLPLRSKSNYAEIIIAKPGQSDVDKIPIETKKEVKKIVSISKEKDIYYIEFQDSEGVEIKHKF